MSEVEETKTRLVRQASRAIVGGFRPSEDPFASWFGRVRVALPHEAWPISDGKPMLALAQFNLTEIPYRPGNLSDIALITIFMDRDILPVHDNANGDGWLLRAYSTLDGLAPIQEETFPSHVKPFPIRWELIEADYPTWDDASQLELPRVVKENYHDLFQTQQGTKIGSWPFTVQSEIFWAPGKRHPACPEYVFQIDTEEKANWMWGDAGFGYFGRGTDENKDTWTLEWQCY